MPEKQEPFIQIPKNLAFNKEITSGAKILYGHIYGLSYDRGHCWASNGRLAEDLGVTPRHLQRLLIELERASLIKIAIDRSKKNQSRRQIYPMSTSELQDTTSVSCRDTTSVSRPSRHQCHDRHDVDVTLIDKRIDKRRRGRQINKLDERQLVEFVKKLATDSRSAPNLATPEITQAVHTVCGTWYDAGKLPMREWQFLEKKLYSAYSDAHKKRYEDTK